MKVKRLLFALAAFSSLSSLAQSASAYTYKVQVTAYGAKCDGSTDDTTAIQNALNSVGDGGEIQFPTGVCVVSGNSTLVLNHVALVGSDVPHWSDAPTPTQSGSFISIGTKTTPPGNSGPFFLGTAVTLQGLNFIYPYQIASSTPVPSPALFGDTGNGAGNILFDNVHVIAAYYFWTQQGGSPSAAYGNIRFVNTDIYAVNTVFTWAHVAESVTFDNFISNPSLCSAAQAQCSTALENWTADHGTWLHVIGAGSSGSNESVGGLQAENLTISGYHTGILVDSNGHLEESLFGASTVFDGVPDVLYVNSNGSITHTSFKSHLQFSGRSGSGTAYTDAAFTLNNPQHPGSQDPNNDHNTLSLDGVTADGTGGPLLNAFTNGGGDIGSINVVGVSARSYCAGGSSNAININAPNTLLMLVGTEISTGNSGCGGLSITASPSSQMNSNFIGANTNF